jgi:hypothetical protein
VNGNGFAPVGNIEKARKTITAIKQALAAQHEPENEPFVSLASVQEPVATNKIYVTREQLAELYPPPAAQPAPVEPDWKAEYLKSVESGCITLDELREARAELDATNRQVEILSDALAESRREVAALKAVQEPVAWLVNGSIVVQEDWIERLHWPFEYVAVRRAIPDSWTPILYTTPPAAKRPWVGLTDEEFEDIELGCRSTLFGKIEAMRKVEAKLKEKNT